MQISAFVDGELPDNEADLLLRRMGQDAELRQKVAEYLAIGRALRGEITVAGADHVHERVSAAIDDKPFEQEIETEGAPPARAIRPLAGFAVAATVALVAIFGLQRTLSVDEIETTITDAAIAETADGYAVPRPMDDRLRQYYLNHGATATANGASGINSRFVSLRLSEEVLLESVEDDPDTVADDADDTLAQP
jgi:hypothetical protein